MEGENKKGAWPQGWKQLAGKKRGPPIGPQRTFIHVDKVRGKPPYTGNMAPPVRGFKTWDCVKHVSAMFRYGAYMPSIFMKPDRGSL